MEHSFDIDLAKEIGVNEAIVVKNFQFWIKKNDANKKHYYDGRTWTYNSVSALSELFPYWTAKQIRTIIENLVSAGILLKGNYNNSPYDRTSWYAFNDESRFLFKQIDLPKRENGKPETGECITDSKPDNKPDTIHSIHVPASNSDSKDKPKKVEQTLVFDNEEQRQTWTNFESWMQRTEIKRIQQMKEPLTPRQLELLFQNFGIEKTLDILVSMDNWVKLLKDRVSAYKTALTWLKK